MEMTFFIHHNSETTKDVTSDSAGGSNTRIIRSGQWELNRQGLRAVSKTEARFFDRDFTALKTQEGAKYKISLCRSVHPYTDPPKSFRRYIWRGFRREEGGDGFSTPIGVIILSYSLAPSNRFRVL